MEPFYVGTWGEGQDTMVTISQGRQGVTIPPDRVEELCDALRRAVPEDDGPCCLMHFPPEHVNTPDDVARDRARWLAAPDVCDVCGRTTTKAGMSHWGPIAGTRADLEPRHSWDEHSRDSNKARDEFVGVCRRCHLITGAVDRAMEEIDQDVASGRVPATVATFSELHDYVDANEYGGLTEDHWFADDDLGRIDEAIEVQARVDTWIRGGRAH